MPTSEILFVESRKSSRAHFRPRSSFQTKASTKPGGGPGDDYPE